MQALRTSNPDRPRTRSVVDDIVAYAADAKRPNLAARTMRGATTLLADLPLDQDADDDAPTPCWDLAGQKSATEEAPFLAGRRRAGPRVGSRTRPTTVECTP